MNATPAAPDELRFGTLLPAGGQEASPLPLRHTGVTAQITGPVASVTVTQEFHNPFPDPVELSYLFPLPHGAAITDFAVRMGARLVRAEVEEQEAARVAYGDARDQGRRAGLLTERRPNLFGIELANVQPGEAIIATVRYRERLQWIDGDYQFVFPMGLTPKFHANLAEAAAVDSPLAAPGEPIGPVNISVTVDAGADAGEPESPSHAIAVTRTAPCCFEVRLAAEAIPNKDFVMRYRVSQESIRAAAWAAGDVVMVTALPPRLDLDAEPAPREFIFVLDRSGSMMGEPIRQARNALRACLRALGPQDRFNLQAFDDRVEWLAPESLPVTQETVERADRWLRRVDARGGTEILGAIDAALRLPADPQRQRYIAFLTDGAVSAEGEALTRIQRQLGSARLFTFGIGPSVNRALLSRMAVLGRGVAEFLQLSEDIEEAIIRFQDRVAFPVLRDLRLTWEGVEAWHVYPSPLPDLYIGQPLELVARFQPTGPGPGRLAIEGRRGSKDVRLEVPLLPGGDADPALARVWARARLDSLNDISYSEGQPVEAVQQEIIRLSKEHRLLTRYTAFVAVDTETAGAGSRRVAVSVPLPEGLDIEGFVGGPVVMAPPGYPSAATPPVSSMAQAVYLSAVPAAGPKVADDPEEPEADQDPLRWLARTQNVDGSWGSGGDQVEMTAAAILAFVRAGHTTRAGHFRRQLQKAVQWLLAAGAGGAAGRARAQALAEMGTATGSPELQAAAREAGEA